MTMSEAFESLGEMSPELRRRTGRGAVDAVVREHGKALLVRAKQLTGGHADAWDLVQDTLVRAMTRRPEDLSEVKVRSWLMTVLANLHIDRCRSARRGRRVTLGEGELLGVPQPEPTSEPAWLSIDGGTLQTCLQRLDPRLRAAYTLQVEQGLTLAAAAARLGVPQAPVGTRVHRARRRLRQLLMSPGLQ
jgi:RNA polymerase sigma-70 factor (ECF subfamily)